MQEKQEKEHNKHFYLLQKQIGDDTYREKWKRKQKEKKKWKKLREKLSKTKNAS